MKDEKYLTVMLHVFMLIIFFYYEMLMRYVKIKHSCDGG